MTLKKQQFVRQPSGRRTMLGARTFQPCLPLLQIATLILQVFLLVVNCRRKLGHRTYTFFIRSVPLLAAHLHGLNELAISVLVDLKCGNTLTQCCNCFLQFSTQVDKVPQRIFSVLHKRSIMLCTPWANA
jgi:hypothetical protein